MKQVAIAIPLTALLVVAILFAVGNFTTYSFGSLTFRPAQTVTVTGTSREQQANNEASFSVGVNEYDSDRDAAVALVNETINGIIADLKEFGIADGDIKTESVAFSRLDDPYRPDVNGQWSASSNITVTLRDASKVNELSNLLSSSGATNVYGPNFRVAEGSQSEEQLLQSAMDNAREKAAAIASGSQAELGKVISVDESMSGGGVIPMFDSMSARGGGAAIEPGTTTVSKSVQVTFELK